MRRFLLSSPRSVAVLVAVLAGLSTVGASIVLWLLAFAPRTADDLVLHVVIGAACGVVVGLLIGVDIARADKAERRVLESLPQEGRLPAVAAVEGGPVPAEPQVRRAAARLAEHRLEKVTGAAKRTSSWWTTVPFGLVMAGNAFRVSGGYWLAVALVAGWVCVLASSPRRERRRAERLRSRLEQLREGLPVA